MVHIAFFILGFMIKYFLLTFFMMAGSCYAQSFPYSFVGQWKGELQWFQTGKQEPQKIPMQLKILPADTVGQFTWQLVYGMNNEDNRPYILKPVDTAKGHWVIDEKNGIVLDQYFIGQRLHGAFTVQTTTIVNSYWLEGDKLFVEFYSIQAKPVSKTGGSSADVPPVDSYAFKGFQKAILYKIDNNSH